MRQLVMTILALGMFFTMGLPFSQAQVRGEMGTVSLGAAISDQIAVQGRLTDAGGIPLNGTYTINFWVYNVAEGGAVICGNIVTPNVPVIKGLFNVTVDLCKAAGAMDGQQLYLGVKVGDDPEMTPRLPINPVPYAFTVRPGATIQGADSYLFIPGSALVKNLNTDTTRWDIQSNGAARIWAGAPAGNRTVYYPINIPSVLYGKAASVKNATIFYRCQNGDNNFITRTVLNKQTDADSFLNIFDNIGDRVSNAAASYSISPAANADLSFSQGILSMFIELRFVDDVNYIDIGGIRLQLGHQ